MAVEAQIKPEISTPDTAIEAVPTTRSPDEKTPDSLFEMADKIAAELKAEEKNLAGESHSAEDIQAKASELAHKQEYAKFGDEHIKRAQASSESAGTYSYLKLAGNTEKLKAAAVKDTVAEDFLRSYISDHAIVGDRMSVELDHELTKPEDYVDACKKRIDICQANRKDAPPAPTLDEFILKEAKSDVRIYVEEKGGLKALDVQVKDLPPETAYKLFMRQYNGKQEGDVVTSDPAYLGEKNRLMEDESRASLMGFSDAALKDGNLTAAIEGYISLDVLYTDKDMNVARAVSSKMFDMQRQVKDHESGSGGYSMAEISRYKSQLQRASERIQKYKVEHK